MFSCCELDLYNGLLLDEDYCNILHIVKVSKFELMTLLDRYRVGIKLNEKGVIHAETVAIKQEIMNNLKQDTYFYIPRGDYIILPDVEIYYGICINHEVVSVYQDRTVRDAKFRCLSIMGFKALFEDVKENTELIQSVNSQLQLRKPYQQLHYYSKRPLD